LHNVSKGNNKHKYTVLAGLEADSIDVLRIVASRRLYRALLRWLIFHPPKSPVDKGNIDWEQCVILISLLHPLCHAGRSVLCLDLFLKDSH
jgi:hypothetical protein